MAAPIAPVRAPGRTAAMPRIRLSCVTSISRSAARLISPTGIHAAGIAVPAIEDIGHVHVDDVAVPQRLVVGDAVADHVIDRRAARLGIAAVVQRSGQRAVDPPRTRRRIRSIVFVVTPGATIEASSSRQRAVNRHALRMASDPSGP